MTNNSQKVLDHRIRVKQRMVDAMGGECQICGYSKCNSSLEFHHINPKEKEFSFGGIRANPKKWITIVKELRKSILLCSNCHREVHAGVTDIPENYSKFDDSYLDYKSKKVVDKNNCSICGELKPTSKKYCSSKCYHESKKRVDWENLDWNYLISTYKTNTAIGRYLGVSDSIVCRNKKKWLG